MRRSGKPDLAWPPCNGATVLLPALPRVRKPARFLGGAEEGAGLVDAFLLLGVRIGIRDHAGAGLDVHVAVLDERSAQHDAGVHLAGGREIPDEAGVEAG